MQRKKISRLTPVNDADAAERHYSRIHHTFARERFANEAPDVIGYHGNRAIAQFDLNGRFEELPDAWRFVVTRWNSPAGVDDHTVGFMDERLRNLFYGDRPKCIGSVAACDVDEEVVVDRLTCQTALVKYLFRYAPDQFGDHEAFEAYYVGDHLPALRAAADDAAGLRLFVTNRVLQEAELLDRPDGTMEYTGRYIAPSTYRYEEYYFDHDGHAERFFGSARVLERLRDSGYGKVLGYLVEEKCGVDRR